MSSTDSSSDAMSKPVGAGCAAVPTDGKGSFSGMATDPVATAASNNPALSTLVTAVKAAGLVKFGGQQVGGKGGGKPDLAMAGGTEPAKLGAALASVPAWVAGKL